MDLQIAGEFASMVDLLLQQPYLHGVTADPRWSLTPPDDWKAPAHPRGFDRVIHLGYRGWPKLPLPLEIYDHCRSNEVNLPLGPLDLHRPWITVKSPKLCANPDVVFGFTDCHFELKFGLVELLFPTDADMDRAPSKLSALSCMAPGSRWEKEGAYLASDWLTAAQYISQGKVFLGDCSALHVLACALGKPVVCYEPMIERLNPIFWPFGKDGPEVTLVRGNDGEMTTDSRHTAETLERVLRGVK